MKRILLIIVTVCLLLTVCGCSSNNDELENDCDCAKKYIYRKTISYSGWENEEVNLYNMLPENAEVIEIFDTTTDSYHPKYDIIYTIHNCK